MNDYLYPNEVAELRRDIKKEAAAGGILLAGFNNRAVIIKKSDNEYVLQSYKTEVCKYNPLNNSFVKLWTGYSVTTMKHVNLFCEFFHIPGFNKKSWNNLETNKNYFF